MYCISWKIRQYILQLSEILKHLTAQSAAITIAEYVLVHHRGQYRYAVFFPKPGWSGWHNNTTNVYETKLWPLQKHAISLQLQHVWSQVWSKWLGINMSKDAVKEWRIRPFWQDVRYGVQVRWLRRRMIWWQVLTPKLMLLKLQCFCWFYEKTSMVFDKIVNKVWMDSTGVCHSDFVVNAKDDWCFWEFP